MFRAQWAIKGKKKKEKKKKNMKKMGILCVTDMDVPCNFGYLLWN